MLSSPLALQRTIRLPGWVSLEVVSVSRAISVDCLLLFRVTKGRSCLAVFFTQLTNRVCRRGCRPCHNLSVLQHFAVGGNWVSNEAGCDRLGQFCHEIGNMFVGFGGCVDVSAFAKSLVSYEHSL